jgi:hypothetical protein
VPLKGEETGSDELSMAEPALSSDEESEARGRGRAPPTVPFYGENYTGWAAKMRSLMEYTGVWSAVALDPDSRTSGGDAYAAEADGDNRSGSEISKSVRSDIEHRRLAQKAHLMLLLALKTPELEALVADVPSGDAAGVWTRLKKHFMKASTAGVIALLGQYWTLRQHHGESVSSWMNRVKQGRDHLAASGHPPDKFHVKSLFINGLVPELAACRGTLVTSAPGSTLDELLDIARVEEDYVQMENKFKRAASMIMNTDANGERKVLVQGDLRGVHGLSAVTGSNLTRGVVCYCCGKRGHKAAQCELRKTGEPGDENESRTEEGQGHEPPKPPKEFIERLNKTGGAGEGKGGIFKKKLVFSGAAFAEGR